MIMKESHGVADASDSNNRNQDVIVYNDGPVIEIKVGYSVAGLTSEQARFIARCLNRAASRSEEP